MTVGTINCELNELKLSTYRDLELSVVEQQSSVGADESVLLFRLELVNCDLCHFSIQFILMI